MLRTVISGCLLSLFLSDSTLLLAHPNVFESTQGWEEISPGGDTSCARGTPFSFFVHRGTSDKVVVDYMGGGACWNSDTCAPGSEIFIDSVESFKEKYGSKFDGIYDHAKSENPVKNWTHVVIPYCTGDLHWGAKDQKYDDFEIKHRGAINAKAVLSWLQKEYAKPSKVLVTGCSAGAYASIYWFPHVRKMYPEAMVRQLSDSGFSPITESFASVAFPEWNVGQHRADWISGLDPKVVDWSKLQIDFLYKTIADYYPNDKLAAYTSAFDSTQRFFYLMMDGNVEDWSQQAQTNLSNLANSTKGFNYFVSSGTDHCVLPYERFYSKQGSNGQYFKDWFSQYINGGDVANTPCPDCVDPDLEFLNEE